MIPFLKQHLAPNRIAVYLVALSALATALIVPLTDVGLAGAASILGSVAVFAGVVVKWLTGWQNYEAAVYQQRLIEIQASARAEQVAQASAPRKPGVSLPR
jgi:hypothetical protein